MFPGVRLQSVPNPDIAVLRSSLNSGCEGLSSHLVEKTTSRVALCYEGEGGLGFNFCSISLGLRDVDMQTE